MDMTTQANENPPTPAPPLATKCDKGRFLQYADAGFLRLIVPIIPHDAELDENSKLKPSQLGKIPGKRKSNDKWVGFADWTQHKTTAQNIKTWDKWDGAGVGIRTGKIVGVDIDIVDAALAEQVEDLALELLGPAPRRVGKAPKRLLPYRTVDPRSKIVWDFVHAETGEVQKLEVLGTGQQFVADGIHPKSGKAYSWPKGHILDKGFDDLTEVTPEQMDGFLEGVKALMADAGFEVKIGRKSKKSDCAAPRDKAELIGRIEDIRSCLEVIPNDQVCWDDWTSMGMAIWAASEGSDEGFEAFAKWSAKSYLDDPATTSDRWDEISNSPPDNIGMGSLVHEARIYDPSWVHGSNDGDTDDLFDELPDLQEEKKKKTWLDKMNDKYALVMEGGALVFKQVFDPELNQTMIKTFKPEAIKTLHDNKEVTFGNYANGEPKKVGMGTAWMKHPKRNSYPEGTTLMANGDAPDGFYNLWTGWGVEPKAGDWSLMRGHIKDIVCKGDPVAERYLMGWMARAVQKPEVQGETAVVLRGDKGTGKGTIGNALVNMFGGHSLHLSKSEQLVGRFNAHLRTAVMVFADEAFFAGDRKNEGTLKALITEAQVTIEPKGVDLSTAKNRTHLFMATNSDWAVPASSEERRYFVVDVSPARRGDFKYFGAIKKELTNGGLAAMLHDLLEYDLREFNVRDIPQTSALLDQKVLSLTGVDKWLYDCLQSGQVPDGWDSHVDWDHKGVKIRKNNAYEAFTNKANFYKCARDIPCDSAWSKRIRKIVGAKDTRSGGVRSLILEPLAECRLKFEEHMGQTIKWEAEPESFEDDFKDLDADFEDEDDEL